MITAAVIVTSIVALVFLIGLFLPATKEHVITAQFKASPESVFETVTNVQQQTSWRSDLKDIQLLSPDKWTEIPKRGNPITFQVLSKIQNERFEIAIVETSGFHGQWIGTFEKSVQGTKVEFKEVITVPNPFFRVISALFFDLDKTMELYMANLRTHLGE